MPWIGALTPTPATGAVHTHTYQITSGFSNGIYNIGNITGGTFSVQFSYTTFPTCGYPTPVTCHATLLSAAITGTAGMAALNASELAFFNANQFSAVNAVGGARRAAFGTRIGRLLPPLAFQSQTLQRHHASTVRFDATPSGDFSGHLYFDNLTLHCFPGPCINQPGGWVTDNHTTGVITFVGQEVAVPAPSPLGLLAPATIMLGVYVHRRNRRRTD